MNSLNSVLIEGKVINIEQEEGGSVKIFIMSTRCNKAEDGEKQEEENTFVPIFVPISRLADFCVKAVSHGKVIRVVGRLALIDGTIRVHAEHIELKGGQ